MKEADIETRLIEWLPSQGYEVIGRQVDLHIGRLDVLAWHTEGRFPIVFEVKAGRAPDSTAAQIFGYKHFIENILVSKGIYNPDLQEGAEYTRACIVAESLPRMIHRLWDSRAIDFIWYTVNDDQIEFHVSQYNYEPYSSIEEFTPCSKLSRLIGLYNDHVREASASQAYSKIGNDTGQGGCTTKRMLTESVENTAELWGAVNEH